MAVLVTLVAAAAGVSACGGGLDMSCGDYVSKDAKTQLDVAAQWASPARDGKVDAGSRMVAPVYREKLVAYCSQDGHRGDKIRDLELGFR